MAYASFAENKLGSLSTRKKGVFVIFDSHNDYILIHQILEAKVKAKVMDRGAVYSALNTTLNLLINKCLAIYI